MDAISITVDFSLRAAKSTPLPEIKSVLAGTIQATNGSEYNTSRAGARIGSGASPPAGYRNVTPSGLG